MILDAVDERLRMLDTHSHREGLLFQGHVVSQQKEVDVPGRMSGRKDHTLATKLTPVRRGHPLQPRSDLVEKKFLHSALEMHLTPRSQDGLPQCLHHVREKIRANVGMRLRENPCGSPMSDQGLVDLAHWSALGCAGIKLPVRKGARPALTIAVIRILDHATLAQDRGEIKAPSGNILTPFQDDRAQAQLNTTEGRKDSCGSATHDHNPPGLRGRARKGKRNRFLRR